MAAVTPFWLSWPSVCHYSVTGIEPVAVSQGTWCCIFHNNSWLGIKIENRKFSAGYNDYISNLKLGCCNCVTLTSCQTVCHAIINPLGASAPTPLINKIAWH